MAERSAGVTVAIPTRNRGEMVARTVESILANDHSDFEIVVVDQSADDRTERALAMLASSRVECRRMPGVSGVAAARNAAVRDTRGEIIAFTDDDCRVPSDWLRSLCAAFRADARVGVVFGNVVPCDFDASTGFVPGYVRRSPVMIRDFSRKYEAEGLSACMGIRRRVWDELRGFDEMLGSGAPLRSAAETDFTMRTLLAGWWIHETPEVTVGHLGFRDWRAAEDVIARYWYGTGAVFAKHARAHPAETLSLLFRMIPRRILSRSRIASSLGTRPHRVERWTSFARGFRRGWSLGTDADGHFRS